MDQPLEASLSVAVERFLPFCYSAAPFPTDHSVATDAPLQWTAFGMAAHNERLTENIVRDELRRLEYNKKSSKIVVEKQKSAIEAIKRLMKSASKSGGGGGGAPEFIISCVENPDFLVVIECKADQKDHISNTCKRMLNGGGAEDCENEEEYNKRTQRYAVDGILHYASRLSKEFNVIAVAVCGESREGSLISTYLHPKGAEQPKLLQSKTGQAIEKLIPWLDYIEHGAFDSSVQSLRANELMSFARDLHDFMRDHCKLTESEKPLMVSGTLIALRNKAFAKAFDEYSPSELQDEWLQVITKEIQKADIPMVCSPRTDPGVMRVLIAA